MDKYINDIVNISKHKAVALKNIQKDLYDCITHFCSKNEVLLFNKRALWENYESDEDIEDGIKMENLEEDFDFTIFSTTPIETAKELSIQIYKKYSKFVVINTFLRGNENIISVDNNRIIKVYKYLSGNINNNFITKKFNNRDIKFIDPITALLFISRNLYHPDLFLDICKNKENKLLNEFIQILKNLAITFNIKRKIEIIQGGKRNIRFNIKNDNIKSFIDKELKGKYKDDIVYVDDKSLDKIISSNSFSIVKELKSMLEKKFKQHFRYTISDMFIFNDFRFKKITLMQGLDKILTVYNNLEYEPVPVYYSNSKLIAHPLVRIRYEIFNLSSLINFVKMESSSIENISKKTIDDCIKLLLETFDMQSKYNPMYAGEWKDDRIEKFKLGSSAWRPNKI